MNENICSPNVTDIFQYFSFQAFSRKVLLTNVLENTGEHFRQNRVSDQL